MHKQISTSTQHTHTYTDPQLLEEFKVFKRGLRSANTWQMFAVVQTATFQRELTRQQDKITDINCTSTIGQLTVAGQRSER